MGKSKRNNYTKFTRYAGSGQECINEYRQKMELYEKQDKLRDRLEKRKAEEIKEQEAEKILAMMEFTKNYYRILQHLSKLGLNK